MPAFTVGKLAKSVIGLGTQFEPADKPVMGDELRVTYVEKISGARWAVELEDGSRWEVPAKTAATPNPGVSWTYAELEHRDQA